MNELYVVISLVGVFIAIAIILLFVSFSNRKNQLIQENLKTALDNQKRQHELELKALRGQMNPHFVHNSLNAIQYYIQQNDVETSEAYLAKFSKLMRRFFDYSRQQSISVKEELELIKNYLEIEKLRFEEKIEYSIVVDSNLDVEEEQIPSMILQPIVENAINHGLFHKQGKGYIKIQLNYINDGHFEVSVIDNGIGIKKASTLNKNLQKDNTSHSSKVLEERLHYLKESNIWNVDFSILDRSSTDHSLSGTEVTLIFKQNINGDED